MFYECPYTMNSAKGRFRDFYSNFQLKKRNYLTLCNLRLSVTNCLRFKDIKVKTSPTTYSPSSDHIKAHQLTQPNLAVNLLLHSPCGYHM